MGTIVETKADFYSSRIPKKNRKTSLVDELLADAEFRRYVGLYCTQFMSVLKGNMHLIRLIISDIFRYLSVVVSHPPLSFYCKKPWTEATAGLPE